jgi:hypothetical protein
MDDQSLSVKNKLLADIEREWGALNQTLGRLNESQLTELHDPQGWSVKDHLVHLAFWERGVCYYLQGKPRHLGMEITEELLLQGNYDQINAVIQQAQQGMSLAEVQALIHYCHRTLLNGVMQMSDADLLKPYRRYRPDEDGEGEGPPVLYMLYGNTAEHFSEHRQWIDELVKG